MTNEAFAVNGGEVAVLPVTTKTPAILMTDFSVEPNPSPRLESLLTDIATEIDVGKVS